ncbi:TPA: hypothetical protein RY435_004019 [Escherichia albertii]|uniref:hypothetical protein n=1 Tax=Escherichia albertii TaxID=208962 RepID=UPI000A702846|nr:hypothetical protein [Escherichia albertii]HEB1530384.1 hypothetical protein [Escherichia albertii]HEB1544467.1 hypothetical protein [Escherichia albertii]
MKKIIRRVRCTRTGTRWVCIQCNSQYGEAKLCPFCHSAIGALKASVTPRNEQAEETQS